jgi:hypothetical protein
VRRYVIAPICLSADLSLRRIDVAPICQRRNDVRRFIRARNDVIPIHSLQLTNNSKSDKKNGARNFDSATLFYAHGKNQIQHA